MRFMHAKMHIYAQLTRFLRFFIPIWVELLFLSANNL
jgi:hypothetical protein